MSQLDTLCHIGRAGYGAASEYVRHLVREDQRRQLKDQINADLLAALDSGDAIEVRPEWWEKRGKALQRRAKPQKKPR